MSTKTAAILLRLILNDYLIQDPWLLPGRHTLPRCGERTPIWLN